MSAGTLQHRAAFHRPATVDGGLGPERDGWEAVAFYTCWAQFKPERGREAIAAGRIESRRAAEIMVRNCVAARAIWPGDSVVIDDTRWNIRSTQVEPVERAMIHLVAEAAE